MDKQFPLIKDDNLAKEYITLLLGNEQDKEAKQTDELLEYISQLEKQYMDIAKELQEVKILLNNLQSPSLKVRLKNNIEKAEVSINLGKSKLSQLKINILQSMKQSIGDFMSKGKQGLIKTIHVIHLKEGLDTVRKTLFQSMHYMRQVSLTCDSISLEMKKGKNHFKNIGRMMRGLPTQSYIDKTKINLLQKNLRKICTSLENLCIHTTYLLHSIEDFEKPSVKKEIKSIESKSLNKKDKTKESLVR